MKKNILLIYFLTLAVFTQKIYSQKKYLAQPRFHGSILLLNGTKYGNDTVSFGFREPYMPEGTDQQVVKVITDNTGNFDVKLPAFDVPIAMNISIRHKGKYSRVFGMNRYFFEKNDNINIDIKLNETGEFLDIYFSGKGSDKYNILTQCSRIHNFDRGDELNKRRSKDDNTEVGFGNYKNIEEKFLRYTELVKELIKKQNSLIENSNLNSRMKKMIRYERSSMYYEWFFRLNVHYNSYKKSGNMYAMNAIKRIYERHKEEFLDPFPSDSLMALCPSYVYYQAKKELSSLLSLNDNKDKLKPDDLYNVFKLKYNGILRERLISNLVIGNVGSILASTTTLDSLFQDAKEYITIPKVKVVYNSRSRLISGLDVYNGVFKDIDGNDISIASLKGKVVLLDIWGWGCSACVIFHKLFHKNVYPFFKNNKNFVYLSVSSDKTKELYERSLKSGRYTSIDYLNVYMKDLGMANHPFSKHYKIGAAPFLLLIDPNGKVYTSVISSDPKQLTDVISEALAIKLSQTK